MRLCTICFSNHRGPVAMCVLYFYEYFIRLEKLLNKGCAGSANQHVRRGSEDRKKHNAKIKVKKIPGTFRW